MKIADKYEVIKVLGEGGFGKVYLSKHLELGILYAIKVIHLDKAKEDDFMIRFRREAQILTRLLHKNSIPLRDFGKTKEGNLYMAMDYCPGKSLREIIDSKGAIRADRVLDLTIQILDVLAEAHKMGIIHRDLKPDNIMIEQDQEGKYVVKVLDFGIARLAEGLDDEAKNSVTVTRSGAIVGTPMFMSPEQAVNEDVDHRSDLYSLGMVMYQMLTGQVPYESQTDVQTLMFQMQQYPAPFGKVRPDLNIPKIIERLVFKSIQKEKEKRFASAQQLSIICQRLLKQMQSPSTDHGSLTDMMQAVPTSHSLSSPSQASRQKKPSTLLEKDASDTKTKLKELRNRRSRTGSHGQTQSGSSGRQTLSGRRSVADRMASSQSKSPGVIIGGIGGIFALSFVIFLLLFSGGEGKKNGGKKKFKAFLDQARTALENREFDLARQKVALARKIKVTEELDYLLKKIQSEEFDSLILKAKRAQTKGKYSTALEFAQQARQVKENREAEVVIEELRQKIKSRDLMKEAGQDFARKDYQSAHLKAKKALEIIGPQATEEKKVARDLLNRAGAYLLYQEALALEKRREWKKARQKVKEAMRKYESDEFSRKLRELVANDRGAHKHTPGRILVGPPGGQAAAQWKNYIRDSSAGQMFRHNLSLRGQFPSQGPHPKGERKWSYTKGVGMVYGQAIAVGEKIIFPSFNRHGGKVFAIHKETQKLFWKKEIPSRIFSTPACVEGKVFIATEASNVYSFDLNSGRQLWKKRLGTELTGSSPVIVGETLYQLIGKDNLYALDINTGKVKWKEKITYKTKEGKEVPVATVNTTPAIWRNYLFIVFIHDRGVGVWVGDMAGHRTWNMAFPFRIPRGLPFFSSPIVSRRGILYFTHFTGAVFAIDLKRQKPLWYKRVWNFNKRKKRLKKLKTGFWIANPALYGNRLFIGGADGFFYALDARSGRLLWQRELGSQTFSSPALFKKRLYIGDRSGQLYCFSMRGKLEWKHKIGNWLEGATAVYDGVVYIGRMSGGLHAVK